MAGSATRFSARPASDRRTRTLLAYIFAIVALALISAGPAFAGQASSGELLFYPCDSCHPVTATDGSGPVPGVPIDFEGHGIVLEAHDVLGEGSAACLACHDDPGKDPGMLKTADGTLVPITGDVSQVCYKCHSKRYDEWAAGTHGREQDKCTSAGCHDPHTPGYMFASALLPFVGSGFQFQVLPTTEPFQPLMPPAPPAPTVIPVWFMLLAAVGVVVAGSQVFMLIRGRHKR